MFTILLLCCLYPPQAPLPPQGPPVIDDTPSKCRCGDGCPLGKDCGPNCACAEPEGRPGPEWFWDKEGKFWWRYGPAEASPVTHAGAVSRPIPAPVAPAMPVQSHTRHAPAPAMILPPVAAPAYRPVASAPARATANCPT